jgi:ABC-type glycerol-3-phosphate transport system permease component
MGMCLSRNYFESIPKSIIESARIDGANEWQILKMIIIPVSKPIISVLGLFAGVSVLQDYVWQMLVLSDVEKQTLIVGLIRQSMNRTGDIGLLVNPIGMSFAAGVILLFPLVVLFLIGNRYFIEGLQGAVKE